MEVVVYVSAVFFALLLFPVYTFNYMYIDVNEKNFNLNVCIFKYLNVASINLLNGKEDNDKRKTKINGSFLKSLKYAYNRIYVDKVIQLADYGLKNQANAYVALAQNAATQLVYGLCKKSPNVKLKNHVVFNEEHSNVRYYLKSVTVVNLLTVVQILFYMFMEKKR